MNKYDKNVRFDFKFGMHGYGKNVKEALIRALETALMEVERNETDFKAVETYETVVNENDNVPNEDL